MMEIERQRVPGIVDLVPTYRSLLVQYDATATSPDALQEKLSQIEASVGKRPSERTRVVHLPTLYGGEYGPDLKFVAENAGLTVEEVVRIHSGVDYLVYMMGFTPGFPYLGGMAPELAAPRLETPRVQTPAGSVGIAESQTGVYPLASPGGWRIIGRTPLRLFDPMREPPSLLSAGDYVRFVPLSSEAEYLRVLALIEKGQFEVVVEPER
jgi:KipI family sensor histidine kinase inhibitor